MRNCGQRHRIGVVQQIPSVGQHRQRFLHDGTNHRHHHEEEDQYERRQILSIIGAAYFEGVRMIILMIDDHFSEVNCTQHADVKKGKSCRLVDRANYTHEDMFMC